MTTAKTGVMDVNWLPERSPRSTTRLGKGPMTYMERSERRRKSEFAFRSLNVLCICKYALFVHMQICNVCAYAKLFDPHSVE